MTKQDWIVVSIAAVVVAGAYLFVTTPLAVDTDRASRTRVAFSSASYAIAHYRLDRGQYPEALQDLLVRSVISGGANSPYIPDRSELTDSWGNEIRYEKRTNAFALVSAGPDRIFGTPDDIVQEEVDRELTSPPYPVKRVEAPNWSGYH